MNAPAIELDPNPDTWAAMIEFDPSRHAAERERFGLPTDRPIVMSGHQAGLWHPGIAAKLFAARALADRINGEAAWLIIDTVDDDPLRFRAPLCDDAGRYHEHTLTLGTDMPKTDDPRAPRLAAIAAAFDRQPGDEPAAARVTRAAIELLGCEMPPLVRSSDLSRASAFAELSDGFRSRPDQLREAYNQAVASHPSAGMGSLGASDTPFWRRTPSGNRLPARQEHLNDDLLPRALVTTGVARASLCDLFIHGTGGRDYEPINDRWLTGAMGWKLAPFVTASATLRLRFRGDAVTSKEADAAVWRAHHARHHPSLLGDTATQARRDQLARDISELPMHDPGRASLFAELHRVLESYREAHADGLRTLAREAERIVERAGEQSLREDRTWPAALHEPEDVARLRDSIASAFAGGS